MRIGIVGLGYGARVHLPAFRSVDGVESVALCGSGSSASLRKAEIIAGDHAFKSWTDLVTSPEVDAVSVAAPPFMHRDIVCAALESGKHVLCEKPFGRSYEEAVEMVEVARRKAELVHAVNFQFRYEPGIAALKKEFEKKSVGKVIRLDVTWFSGGGSDRTRAWTWRNDTALGGGVLNEFGSHVIDYVQWITGEQIKSVYAHCKIMHPLREDSNGVLKEVTGEDAVDLICELSGDITCTIKISNCCPHTGFHHIDIYGSEGGLFYEHRKPFSLGDITLLRSLRGQEPQRIDFSSGALGDEGDTRFASFKKVAEAFVSSAIGRFPCPLPDFASGMAVRKMVALGKTSAKVGWVMSAPVNTPLGGAAVGRI